MLARTNILTSITTGLSSTMDGPLPFQSSCVWRVGWPHRV